MNGVQLPSRRIYPFRGRGGREAVEREGDREREIERERDKTFTYLGSTLAEDGKLDVEVTNRVHSGWKNRKRVSGVLCDRK